MVSAFRNFSGETAMHQFEAAYLATTYEVYPPGQQFDLFIARENQPFSLYCQNHGIAHWAIITAYNPYSKTLADEQNYRLNDQLAAELKQQGVSVCPAVGVPEDSDWQPELSFFALNISRSLAARLGRQFQQNAIVVGGDQGVADLLWLND